MKRLWSAALQRRFGQAASAAVRPALIALALLEGAAAFAQSPITQGMGIDQRLGAKVPADVPFKDEMGQTVTLKNYLGQRPVVLLPIFYKCQSGCALITDSLVKTLEAADHPHGLMGYTTKPQDRPLALGRDLDVVMLGIDPRETPELAADKRNLLLQQMYDRSNPEDPLYVAAQSHWHLLTGTLSNIRKVTDAVGVHYYFNPATGVIRHPTCSVILTPSGTVSSYTIGNEFPTRFMETGLALAAHDQVGQKADQSFMFGCVILDPSTGRIRFIVENIVRVACVLTLLVMGIAFYLSIRNERRQGLPAGGKLRGV